MDEASEDETRESDRKLEGAGINRISVSRSLNYVSPDERISIGSFKRRRSVYEPTSGSSDPCRVHETKSEDLDIHSLSISLGSSVSIRDSNENGDHTTNSCTLNENEGSTVVEKGCMSIWSQSNGSTSRLRSIDPSNSSVNKYSTVSRQTEESLRKQEADRSISYERKVQPGFEVVWLNFTYTIEPNIFEDPRWGKINKLFHKERRTILKNLSGGFQSGEMIALMGPSGTGKTCLLECIAGLRAQGIEGRMLLRGCKNVQMVIVPQHDNFMAQFTVEELIAYGSKMKNPRSADHKSMVNKVIKQLGLEGCRRNNIRKCSGGQQKRVAIAQELVSKPNILILDEPTSGLDSSCCYQTVKVLRDVLNESAGGSQPMAMVATIHQPSAKVIRMFDHIYVLSKKGHFAYTGPPGRIVDTIRIVTGIKCPTYCNPCDFILELVSYDYGHEPVDKLIAFEREKSRLFERDFALRSRDQQDHGFTTASDSMSCSVSSIEMLRSNIGPQVPSCDNIDGDLEIATDEFQMKFLGPRQNSSTSESNIDKGRVVLGRKEDPLQQATDLSIHPSGLSYRVYSKYRNNSASDLRKTTNLSKTGNRFLWHLYLHCQRSFKQSIRDPILSRMRILIHVVFALLAVVLYGKKSGEARGCPPVLGLPIEITDPDNEVLVDHADNVSFLFMSMMQITYVALMSMTLTVPLDIKTVGREYRNGWFGTWTYSLGKTIADLPFIILYTSCYCFALWYFTNQARDHIWRFFSFTGLSIICALNAQSYGLILGSLFVNSVTAATFLGPVTTLPWYLFTGFTKRLKRIYGPLRTASNFMYTRHIFEGLIETVYGFERCNCSAFLEKYYQLRQEETVRLGQLISAESLSSLDYYDGIDTIRGGNESQLASLEYRSSELVPEQTELSGLVDSNEKANSLFSFGLDFEPTCPANYRNFAMLEFELEDSFLESSYISVMMILLVIRLLTIIVMTWKIRTREL